MKINCEITFLINGDRATIELYDRDAGLVFFSGELTPAQAMQALSRLSHTDMARAEVFNLDCVGQVQEHRPFEFAVPNGLRFGPPAESERIASELAQELCPEGWTPDLYFGSQTSFFERDGQEMARTTIRRWVDREDADAS